MISEVPEGYPLPTLANHGLGIHQPEVRFDIRAERAESEYLFKHPAGVLQDRLVRLGGGDRTKQIPIPEWERVYQQKALAARLLHQARVLVGKPEEVLPRAQTGLTESAEKVQRLVLFPQEPRFPT